MYTNHCFKVLLFVFFIFTALTYTIKKLVSDESIKKTLKPKGIKPPQNSTFSEIKFFAVKGGRPYIKLFATESEWEPSLGLQIHESPNGVLISDKNEKMNYSAQSGLINENGVRSVLLKNKVKLTTDSSIIHSDEVQYRFIDEYFYAHGNVWSQHRPENDQGKIDVYADKLKYWNGPRRAIYDGNVKGELKRKRAYEPGLNFSATTISLELNKSYVELQENVMLKKQGLIANALYGEIYLENYNKKLKYYQLSDDVKVRETITLGNGKKISRRAFAEKLEGFNQRDRIVLTGSPKVIQEEEIIKGNKISLTQNNEIIEVDDANSKFIIKGK